MEPNTEDENGPYWDPWFALNLQCGGYSSDNDGQAIAVLKGIRDGLYNTAIAARADMAPSHVELWQYIFCSADWCEYGTSPRGCFAIDKSRFESVIEGWQAYYQRRWIERH